MNSLMSRMPAVQRVHLGGAAGLAAGFHDAGDRSYTFRNDSGPLGRPPPLSFSRWTAERGQVGARAAAVLEQHRLAAGQLHDVFHGVVDRLDEAGAALRVFVLRWRACFTLSCG